RLLRHPRRPHPPQLSQLLAPRHPLSVHRHPSRPHRALSLLEADSLPPPFGRGSEVHRTAVGRWRGSPPPATRCGASCPCLPVRGARTALEGSHDVAGDPAAV